MKQKMSRGTMKTGIKISETSVKMSQYRTFCLNMALSLVNSLRFSRLSANPGLFKNKAPLRSVQIGKLSCVLKPNFCRFLHCY